jgi:prepilin signal peptidase PulO-like enzyme (type II secretory pathway)
MQLHKNKILIFSATYIVSLIVIASLFGMWHNTQIKDATNDYLQFLVMLVLLIAIVSFLYFSLFKVYRKEIEEREISESGHSENDQQSSETTLKEEKTKETFDKEGFISGILPSSRKPLAEYCEETLQNLAGKMGIVQGLFYIKSKESENFEPLSFYAYYSDKKPPVFKIGESLPGQSVKDKRVVVIQDIPDNYIPVVSGLGSGKPKTLVMIPVIAEGEPVGLIEITVFTSVDTELEPALKELGAIIGKNIIKLMK